MTDDEIAELQRLTAQTSALVRKLVTGRTDDTPVAPPPPIPRGPNPGFPYP